MPWPPRLSGAEGRSALHALTTARLCWAAVIVATVVRMIVAASIPLTPDEAYYWIWSRHLQFGYFDHPPMVALWIRAGTALFGDSAFGVRCLGPVSALAGSWLLWDAARAAGRDGNMAVRAVALLNATLMINLGALTMTPDTPLVFFATLAVWSFARLIAHWRMSWSVLVGLSLGLACESKYTAVLMVAGAVIWCVTERRCWRSFGWLGAGVLTGAVCVLPNVIWNAEHGWASILKQGGRTTDWHPSRAFQFLGELLGGQIALATPWVFVLFVVGLWQAARRWKDDTLSRLLVLLVVLPAGVFFQHALGDRVQANWPAFLFPACALAAAMTGRRVVAACTVGGLMAVAVYGQALFHLLPLSPHHDVVARQTEGWASLGSQIQRVSGSDTYIYADDYAVASELAFYAPRLQIAGWERRWELLSRDVVSGQPGLFLIRTDTSPLPLPIGWHADRRLVTVCRLEGRCYDLIPVRPVKGAVDAAIVPLPRPKLTSP